MDKRKRNLAVGFTAAVAGSLLIMGSILLQTQLYPQVSHFLSSSTWEKSAASGTAARC